MTVKEQARELGVALANSPEFARMKLAQAAIEGNEPLTRLIDELQEKRQHIVNLLSGEEQDGEEALTLTGDIERLQGQLTENPFFQELIEAEGGFSTLLTSIDEEINACIGVVRNGCGGDCGACGGCKH